jgi:hypothetical protein
MPEEFRRRYHYHHLVCSMEFEEANPLNLGLFFPNENDNSLT